KKGGSWIDSENNLYLFGGIDNDDTKQTGLLIFCYLYLGYYNDFWKFNGVNWTWIGGDQVVDQHGIYGEKGIPDKDNYPGARYYPSTWIDSENNLYLFGG